MARRKLLKQAVSSSAFRTFAAAMAAAYYLFVRWTSRVQRPHPPAGGPFIVAMWHGQIGMLSELRFGDHSLVALISSHRDGQLITRCAHHYGIDTVIGSSTRGGVSAVRQLLRMAGAGHNLFITPDGPRGPLHKVNNSIFDIARLSGLSILPAAIGNSAGWELRSWDRFRIPAPFRRIAVRWGEPIAAGSGDAAGLEETLNGLQNDADGAANRHCPQKRAA